LTDELAILIAALVVIVFFVIIDLTCSEFETD
jgi:hypothetical protein